MKGDPPTTSELPDLSSPTLSELRTLESPALEEATAHTLRQLLEGPPGAGC